MTQADAGHDDLGDAIFIFTRESSRAVDRAAVEEFGLPNIVLMENAAGAVEAEVLEALDEEDGPVLICCGPGNNGGDGLAAARRLHNAGVTVAIALCADPASLRGDPATHLRVAQKMQLPIREIKSAADLDAMVRAHGDPALIVDALFGTGLDRALEGAALQTVQWINAQEAKGVFVLAVDAPSGLDCDTGEALGGPDRAVRADVTVALCGVKQGFLAQGADDYLGEVVVGDIGVPYELLERFGTRFGG